MSTGDPTPPNHDALADQTPDNGAEPSNTQGTRQPAPPVHDLADNLDVNSPPDGEGPSLPIRIKTLLIGKARDLQDESLFQHVTLVAFLAWVGLGADGLSSSCYGPPEAFKYLGDHVYLAVFLSLATIITVFVISACYSHIIEEFPSGGGGYLAASKL
ncbi:MAG TPA: hypothetical protein VHV77_16285, partial [Pirellulales bacterium]|nr:hypothetical protein [Pirellulales bacterium]